MKKTTLLVVLAGILAGCASYKTKYVNEDIIDNVNPAKYPVHSVILLGNLEGKHGFDLGQLLSIQSSL